MQIFRKVVQEIDRDHTAEAVPDQDYLTVSRQVIEDAAHHSAADRFIFDISAHLVQI